jgi:hypothetical protein
VNRALVVFILTTVVFSSVSAPVFAQSEKAEKELRLAESYDALSQTSFRVLSQVYRHYLKGASRFGPKQAEVEVMCHFFLARCYLIVGQNKLCKSALQSAIKACPKTKDNGLLTVCQAALRSEKNGLFQFTGFYKSTNSLLDSSFAKLKKRDAAFISFLSGTDPINEKDCPPDFVLKVGETLVGSRKVIETLSFWDPMRSRLAVWGHARKALRHSGITDLQKTRGLMLSGKLKDALEVAKTLKSSPGQALYGALLWRLGKNTEAQKLWQNLIAKDERSRAIVLRLRAIFHAKADAVLADTEKRLRQLKAKSGKGTVGLKRHLHKNRAMLWSLALLRQEARRGSSFEGRDALLALKIAEKQFPAGARGELYKHEDPRFPFVIGELYIAAHRYREALSYIYDPSAVIAQFPEAIAVRKGLQELSLIESLGTNDAELEAGQDRENSESTVSFQDYSELLESDSVDSKNSGPGKDPGSSVPAYLVMAAGLFIVALAAMKLRRG